MIDDRVGSRELQPHIPKTTPTKITRLDYADACWLGNGPHGPVPVGVERKTIDDLVNCIDDGRLSGSQLLGLLSSYYRVILLVEGLWRGNPQNGLLETWRRGKWGPLAHGNQRWMVSAVTNFLHRLSADSGVIVWRTGRIEESAKWISDTYHNWQKKWTDHKTHYGFYDKRWTPTEVEPSIKIFRPSLVERVAVQLKGVREKRAIALAKRFHNVIALALATEGELMEVEGIGKGLAVSIRRELGGEEE